jgi:hypothetical protein
MFFPDDAEVSGSAFWLQKPPILRACMREEDAGGREAGAPSAGDDPSFIVSMREEDAGGREAGAPSAGDDPSFIVRADDPSFIVLTIKEGSSPADGAPASLPPASSSLIQDIRLTSVLLLLSGGGVCGTTAAGRAAAGAGPGRGPPPAVWRGAAVLRRRWPPCPCRGTVRCGLRLVDGGGGWCWCGAATHAALSVAACNLGPPSSKSASTSGLSRPVFPRRLWRVVGWVGFLLGQGRWGGERAMGGVLPSINIGTDV